MQVAVSDPVYLACIYRLTAVNFWESAKILSQTMEVDTAGIPTKVTAIPLYFLASHATELFLKSALLKRGFPEEALRKFDYRHNLDMLMEELLEQGVSITSDTIHLINRLHAQHQSHALRYTALIDNGQKTFMPPSSLVFLMLEELLMLTRISTMEEALCK